MASGVKRPPDANETSGTVYDIGEQRRKLRPSGDQSGGALYGGGDNPPPNPPSAAERKFEARKRNEQTKLIASGLSGLGFGLIAISFVQPLLKDAVLLVKEPHWGWWATAVGLHVFAHFTLRTELMRED